MQTNNEKLITMAPWLQYAYSEITNLDTLTIPQVPHTFNKKIISILEKNHNCLGLITEDSIYLLCHIDSYFILSQSYASDDCESVKTPHQQLQFLRNTISSVYPDCKINFVTLNVLTPQINTLTTHQSLSTHATNNVLRNTLIMAITNRDVTACMKVVQQIMNSNQAYQFFQQTGKISSNVRPDYLIVSLIAILTQLAISASLNANYVYNLSDSYLQRIPVTDVPYEGIVQEFISDLLDAPERTYRAPVSLFMYLVQQKIFEKIVISEIADQIGISSPQLRRLIKEALNTTPLDYINKQKIMMACSILSTEHNIKIFEIAERLHYYDTSHFTREFVKYTKITPKEFQQFSNF